MLRLVSFLLLSLLLLPTQVLALTSNWQRDGAVDVRMISGLEGVGQRKMIPLGLEVKLAPGWHTYWRSPGVAGLPPQFDWTKSETDEGNLKDITILYPAPKRYIDNGLETIGYQNHVLFPIQATLRQVGQALKIKTTLSLLVCSTMCVPKTFDIELKVPKDAAIEGAEADLLNPVIADIPGPDESRAGLTLKNITTTKSGISFEITSPKPINNPDVFIESEHETAFAAPIVQLSADQLDATLTVKLADPKEDFAPLVGAPITATVVDEGHALEAAQITIPPIGTPDARTAPPLSLRAALLLAIAGGFILNLMPCVLPVLSLKILSVIGHGGSHIRIVQRSFLTTAAGIMFSFLLLAIATLAFKKLGLVLGWGVQFQQPLFLILLILVLTFFTANMWGLFEIGLPRFLTNKLSDHHPKMAGDFATGALATLLATPCTAPFLGTAIGFALAAGTARNIIAIFVALGFGMTLPYLAFAIIPELVVYLPKPGAWTRRLRFLLGFLLALTTAWLLWVLSAQVKLEYVMTEGVCMVGIIALLGIPAKAAGRNMVRAGLLVLAVMAVSLALSGTSQKTVAAAPEETSWQAFDEAAIPIQVEAGHVVFVDITADWCLTCKANKKFVLSDEDIKQRLFHSGMIAMQGDWTTPDPAVTNFLHKFRRYGIPFDVVYGPGAPQGITLPELLNHDTVMEALNRAAKPMSDHP